MRRRNLLAMGLVAAVACTDGTNPNQTTGEKGSTGGGATVSGIVYGFTAAPDSQRMAIAGATVVLIRVGDFVPPGPDTTEVPPLPPGPDTTLMNRSGMKGLVDSVVPPPDTISPPPPAGCGLGVTVATVVSGSDGRWSADGLEAGVYNVQIYGPANTSWLGIEACGYQIPTDSESELTLYLILGPGPDPIP